MSEFPEIPESGSGSLTGNIEAAATVLKFVPDTLNSISTLISESNRRYEIEAKTKQEICRIKAETYRVCHAWDCKEKIACAALESGVVSGEQFVDVIKELMK